MTRIMHQQLAVLIHKLHKRTMEGAVKWEESASDGFQASFPKYAVRINEQEGQRGLDYIIQIYDEEGRELEAFLM
jgi:hypothetical protein